MDLTSLWQRLMTGMEKRISHQDVEIWLTRAQPTHFEGQTLYLDVGNAYYADWIRENYQSQLEEEAASVLGMPISFKYTYAEEPTAEVPRGQQPDQAIDPQPRGLGVNRSQTFERFVVGECNNFAHAAALAVSDVPAENYNPLFIYGATGLGKTHLMHAVANRVLTQHRDARVVYVTAEHFTNEMIQCLRHKRMEDFRAKYRRRATVLLVDDVQFLSGKERTQEEFFHTFNALQTGGRQVVLTSDVEPRDIDKLEPRLRTRFEGGLLADMQAPDRETLQAILLQKAEAHNLKIPDDLTDAITRVVAGNIRELEGILNRLAALHVFYHRPLTLEFAREQLPNVFNPETPQVTVAGIIESVARFHSIRSADITGNKRTRSLTRPRHVAMYLARTHTGLSFPELGREFGGRDHSTVQYGYNKVKEAVTSDTDLLEKVRMVERSLGLLLRD